MPPSTIYKNCTTYSVRNGLNRLLYNCTYSPIFCSLLCISCIAYPSVDICCITVHIHLFSVIYYVSLILLIHLLIFVCLLCSITSTKWSRILSPSLTSWGEGGIAVASQNTLYMQKNIWDKNHHLIPQEFLVNTISCPSGGGEAGICIHVSLVTKNNNNIERKATYRRH
jgi:hypothetical protein